MQPTTTQGSVGDDNDKGGTLLEVIDLAESLRQERLFISNERSSFYHLNETLLQSCNTVNELSWICAQHRQNLNNLVLARPDTGLRTSCQKANVLENTRFVDAHKADGVKYQHVLAYINLFNFCYANPYQLAQLLATGDQLLAQNASPVTADHVVAVTRTISTGLYGCALNSTDTRNVLQLLKHLIEIQIVTSENPRRMLRTGSCAFARFYHSLHESLFSAKMFLTVALNDAVMRVLIDDEFALELDPSKAAMNLPPAERQKRFGAEQDAEYGTRVRQYVQETTGTLHKFVAKFIRSLSHNWCLFPITLRWLVKTMCYELRRAKFDERCIYEMLTDMVLVNFICPAIVSPEIYGITTPISENARSNLITVGQVLQQMALLKYQSGDRKFHELFAKFEMNEVSDLLTQLLETETPDPTHEVLTGATAATSQSSSASALYTGEVQRTNVLVTQGDLNAFVEFIRIVLTHDELNVSGESRRKLGDILGQLPDAHENFLKSPTTPTAINSNSSKTNLISLGKQTKQKLSKSLSLSAAQNQQQQNQSFEEDTGVQYDPAVVLVIPVTIHQGAVELLSEEEVMNRLANGQMGRSAADEDDEDDDENSEEHLVNATGNIMENGVEIIGAGATNSAGVGSGHPNGNASSLTDILSEQNVVELQRQQRVRGTENPEMIILKADRTKHFAMINDDVSIGNTSDNLEAVSEAHSNHSVASSLDLEDDVNDQNDNLSDMVSANVSGRGSPNISGRDTPSSQVTEGNELGNLHRPAVAVPAAKMLNKARSDIEDKFCKFEIKKLPAGDETISIMSDTWSTDVLASDSETTLDAGGSDRGERDRQFSTPLIPASVILPGDNDFVATGQMGNGALPGHCRGVGMSSRYDISETQSESAWSMDVLASDSEKLAEIDTDDNQSIAARSDITDASSAPEGGVGGGGGGGGVPDSPFFASRSSNGEGRGRSNNAPESPAFSARNRGGGGGGESVFFGSQRRGGGGSNNNSGGGIGGGGGIGEENNNTSSVSGVVANGEDSRFMAALRRSGNEMAQNNSNNNIAGENQLINAGGGGGSSNNPFLTPHRNSSGGGGGGSERTKKFYSARQQSSESNHSSIFDGDLKRESFDSWKESGGGGGHHKHHHKQSGGRSSNKSSSALLSHEEKDNSSGGGEGGRKGSGGGSHKHGGVSKSGRRSTGNEVIIKTNPTLTNPFGEDRGGIGEGGRDGGGVERRATSMEQRNVTYDGRRNGMMQMMSSQTMRQTVAGERANNNNKATSKNYENHEIIVRHSSSGGGEKKGGAEGTVMTTTMIKTESLMKTTMTTTSKTKTTVYRENSTDTVLSDLMDLVGGGGGVEGKEPEEVESDRQLKGLVQRAKTLSLSSPPREQPKVEGEKGHGNGGAVLLEPYRNGLNLPNGTVTKTGKFTGAIPKSISFDATADKKHEQHRQYQQMVEESRENMTRNSSFLNKIRQGLKSSARKGNNNGGGTGGRQSTKGQGNAQWETFNNGNNSGEGDVGNLIDIEDAEPQYQETSEEILAKYRRKVSTASSEANASDSTTGSRASSSFKSKNSSDSDYQQQQQRLSGNGDLLRLSGQVQVSTNDLFQFNNAKKKLRIVLSSADVHTKDFRCSVDNTYEFPLLIYLKIQLAQALNLDDLQQLAYVQEAIRAIVQMSTGQRQSLIGNMYSDMVQRQKYLKYLMRLRQSLLGALKSVERYEERLKRDREMCNRHLVDCCVRLFMEKREGLVDELQRQFSELTQLGDEKIDLLEEFVVSLMAELQRAGMSEWQLADARISMERILLQRLYRQVMFPNDDADILRDQMLRDHIKKLSKVITPEHPKLSIPQEYLIEAPWFFAQQQILQISAYKTALEKVRCVARCILAIMNLLSMSSGRTPSADDLTPVLIFVLIKANPPYLLSTIQYVNCFLGEKLEGQDRYYWTQFCAAVQFMKTMMDYGA